MVRGESEHYNNYVKGSCLQRSMRKVVYKTERNGYGVKGQWSSLLSVFTTNISRVCVCVCVCVCVSHTLTMH